MTNDFKMRRTALGFSQVSFAKIAGVSQSAISNYENGTREIPKRVWEILKGCESKISDAYKNAPNLDREELNKTDDHFEIMGYARYIAETQSV